MAEIEKDCDNYPGVITIAIDMYKVANSIDSTENILRILRIYANAGGVSVECMG